MAKILIVEDEKEISDLLVMNLKLVGHTCKQAFDGNEAKSLLLQWQPDLALLDVMLPGSDGFSLLEQRVLGEIPVILLTAKSATADKVKGLRLGADDYITKPFEAVELLARVEAVLRRTGSSQRVFTIGVDAGADDTGDFGGAAGRHSTVIYLDRRIATVDGVEVELTNQEFALLEVLIENRNLALSRDKLLDLAWGYDYYGDTRTVDVHITKLRKKLKLEQVIKTVYKHGYRLETQDR